MNKFKIKGFSLIELLISFLLMAIILPVIYKVFYNVQIMFYVSGETEKLESDTKISLEQIRKDIKASSAIFDSNVKGLSLFKDKFIPDGINEIVFTKTDGSYSNSIIMMKYSEEKKINFSTQSKVLSLYKIVCFYPSYLPDGKNYYNSKIPFLMINRLESNQSFVDKKILTSDEITEISKNIKVWEFPEKNFTPDLPSLEGVSFNKSSLPVTISDKGIIFNGKELSNPGIIFNQSSNNITVSFYSARKIINEIKKVFLTESITAISFQNN